MRGAEAQLSTPEIPFTWTGIKQISVTAWRNVQLSVRLSVNKIMRNPLPVWRLQQYDTLTSARCIKKSLFWHEHRCLMRLRISVHELFGRMCPSRGRAHSSIWLFFLSFFLPFFLVYLFVFCNFMSSNQREQTLSLSKRRKKKIFIDPIVGKYAEIPAGNIYATVLVSSGWKTWKGVCQAGGERDPPLKGEKPAIVIKLSQSYHPTLAAKQAWRQRGRGRAEGGQQQALHCSNRCVYGAVDWSRAAADSLLWTSSSQNRRFT